MPADPFARAYQAALGLFDLRRYHDAEGAFRQALVYDPSHAEAHAYLSLAILFQNWRAVDAQPARLAEALREARQAISLQPGEELGYVALGWSALAGRKPDETLRASADLLRLATGSIQGWQLAAAGWAQKREWEKSLQCANQGLRHDPDAISLLNSRSNALIMLGRAMEARDSTTRALALDPESNDAFTQRGWLALLDNQPAAALGHFRQALRLDPLSEAARQGFLAALQSRNPLYRLLMRYGLFMARFTHAEGWAVAYGLASVSTVLHMAAQACFPLYLVYLPWRILYGVFVFFSWISDALFALLLRYHPGGRLLLSKDEIAESNALAFCLIYFLGNLGALIWTRQWGFLAGMVLAFFLLVPAAAIFKIPPRSSGKRAALASLVALLVLTGLCGQGLTFARTPFAALPWVFFFLGAFSLPWIASLLLLFE